MEEEILDENLNPIGNDSDYDATSEFKEGYSLKRITFKSLMSFVLSVLNFEKGILFSIKELIIRPRIVIEEYLKNDRKKLINPIRFLVFSTAFAAFLSLLLISKNPEFNTVQINMGEGFNEGWKSAEKENLKNTDTLSQKTIHLSQVDSAKLIKKEHQKEQMKNFGVQVQELTKKNSDKFTFIIVLFFSFFTFLFFRKSGYNLTENLVVNSYMASITNVITIISVIPAFFTNQIIYVIIGSIVGIIYTIYFWVSVYNRKSFGGVLRSILVYLASYSAFILALGIIASIYIAIILSS